MLEAVFIIFILFELFCRLYGIADEDDDKSNGNRRSEASSQGEGRALRRDCQKHLLAGGTFADFHEANERALHWCKEEIGQEIHGTTKRKPYLVVLAEERPRLNALPASPFAPSCIKEES